MGLEEEEEGGEMGRRRKEVIVNAGKVPGSKMGEAARLHSNLKRICVKQALLIYWKLIDIKDLQLVQPEHLIWNVPGTRLEPFRCLIGPLNTTAR